MGHCGHSVTIPLRCSFILTLFYCYSVGPAQTEVLQDKSAPARVFHGLQLLAEHTHLPSTNCIVNVFSDFVLLCHHGPLQRVQGNLLQHLEYLLSSFFSGLGICRTVSHFFSSPLPVWHLLAFLKYAFPLSCWAQLCPSVGPLELSGTSSV